MTATLTAIAASRYLFVARAKTTAAATSANIPDSA